MFFEGFYPGSFVTWMRSRAIGPLMGELQAHGRTIVSAELDKADGKLQDLTPEQRKAVEQVARGVMQKLLHKPMANVRKAAAGPLGGFDGAALAEALAVLFELAAVSNPQSADGELELAKQDDDDRAVG